MAGVPWHILTGEYPPRPGGVSDYSAHLAGGLARAGAEVHVWAPAAENEGPAPAVEGVVVHRLTGGWSRAGLARLGAALDAFAPPRRLLVQYTPGAWGRKGLNLGFCRWLVEQGRRDEVRLMFHEVCYPWRLRDKPTRWLLAAGQRWMARTLLKAGSTVYISIPEWEPLLRAAGLRDERPVIWLPVPSTVPEAADVGEVAALRRRLAPAGQTVVGSFGTYGAAIGGMLAEVLPPLLGGRDGRVGVLIGRGSETFAARLRAAHPVLAGRLIATGGLPPEDVSRHLQACDLLVQPYPDGVSSRRTTVMAGLAHGRPVATTAGPLTEPVWSETGAVALAPMAEPGGLARLAEALLADPEARARLAAAARLTYEQLFSLERTVVALLRA